MLLAYERQPAARSDLFAVVPDAHAGFFTDARRCPILVLSRKTGESVYIGEGDNRIEVILLEVCTGHRVRIGIAAPDDVPILRKEIAGRGDQPDDRT